MILNRILGLFEHILITLFRKTDIVRTIAGKEVLSSRVITFVNRSYLLRKLTKGKIEGISLQHIRIPHGYEYLHDFPCDFKVLILTGGYTEEIPITAGIEGLSSIESNGKTINLWMHGDETVKKIWKPFSFHHTKAEQLRRICEEGFNPTWALYFVGPKKRDFGFMGTNGWMSFSKLAEKNK